MTYKVCKVPTACLTFYYAFVSFLSLTLVQLSYGFMMGSSVLKKKKGGFYENLSEEFHSAD